MLVSARAMLITGARQTHCWNIGSATVSSTALRSVRLDADLLRSLFCVSRSGLVPLNASYSEPSPSGAQVAPRRGRANPAAAETIDSDRQSTGCAACSPQLFSDLTNGKTRIRLPVALNIALATAGPIGGTPGSPTPVGGAEDLMT